MLTTVAIFRDPWQAHLFRTRLEAEGFLAFVQYSHHVDVNWLYSYALGCVRVQVMDGDVGAVRDVIRRIDSEQFRAELLELFGDLDEPCCPTCGSRDSRIRRNPFQVAFAILVILLVRMPMPPDPSKRICRKCGARWDT